MFNLWLHKTPTPFDKINLKSYNIMITYIWVDESLLLKSLLLLLCQGDVVESMAERRLTTTLTRGERSLSQGGGCLSHNAGSTVSTSESLRVTVLRPRSGDTGGGVQGYGHQSSPPWHHLNTERVRHTHIASNSLIPRTHISSPKLQFSFFQLLINHLSSCTSSSSFSTIIYCFPW